MTRRGKRSHASVGAPTLLTDSMMEDMPVPSTYPTSGEVVVTHTQSDEHIITGEEAMKRARMEQKKCGTSNVQSVSYHLNEVCVRVHSAWKKIGLSEIERHNKWQDFLSNQLQPLVDGFCELSEAEEANCAAETARLVKEAFVLSRRLEEVPRHAVLSTAVQHVLNHQQQQQQTDQVNASALEELTQCGIAEVKATGNHHDSGLSPIESEALQAAVAQLSNNHHTTHRETNVQLQEELDRLNGLAEYRLHLLRLLEKQRILLEQPAATQAKLRALYAARCFAPQNNNNAGAETNSQRSTATFVSCVSAVSGRTAAPVRNSSYMTALQAMMPPPPSATTTTTTSSSEAATREALPPLAMVGLEDSIVLQQLAEVPESAEEEIRLFLTTSLYGESMDTRKSFFLVPRPTVVEPTIIQQPERVTVANNNNTCEKIEVRAEEAAGRPTTSRGTIFEADTSEVDRHGKNQDLSLRRIIREADTIFSLIEEANTCMNTQADEELACIKMLIDFKQKQEGGGDGDGAATLRDIEERLSELRASFASQHQRAVEEEAAAAASCAVAPSVSGLSSVRHTAAGGSRAESNGLLTVSSLTQATSSSGTDAVVPSQLLDGAQLVYLPPAVRRLLGVLSFAPILHFLQCKRAELQQQASLSVSMQLERGKREMEEARVRYYDVTKDVAFSQPLHSVGGIEETTSSAPIDYTSAAFMAQPLSACVSQWEDEVKSVESAMQSIAEETAKLSERLQVIAAVAPLLQSRQAILDAERELNDGRRERLLSKKINMAKQLLMEEGVRRRVSKELPLVMKQLEEQLTQWDALAGAGHNKVLLLVDGINVREVLHGEQQNARRAASSSPTPPPPSKRRLAVSVPSASSASASALHANSGGVSDPASSSSTARRPLARSVTPPMRPRSAVKSCSPTPSTRMRSAAAVVAPQRNAVVVVAPGTPPAKQLSSSQLRPQSKNVFSRLSPQPVNVRSRSPLGGNTKPPLTVASTSRSRSPAISPAITKE